MESERRDIANASAANESAALVMNDEQQRIAAVIDSFGLSTIFPRPWGTGGSWVYGQIADHSFEALVFPSKGGADWRNLSEFGVEKLYLYSPQKEQVAEYLRGWTLEPASDDIQLMVAVLGVLLPRNAYPKDDAGNPVPPDPRLVIDEAEMRALIEKRRNGAPGTGDS